MGLFTSLVKLQCVVILASAAGIQWPSAIKRCSMNDPNLNKCVMKQTAQAIAKMSKGVPAIGLRSLDPLRNASFDVASHTGPVVLDIHTYNVMITGPSKVQMKKVYFDKKTSTYYIEGYHNLLKMAGSYNVKGNILVFPVNSAGTFDFELRGGFANHSIKLANNARSSEHGKVHFDLKSVKSMKVSLHDRLLGEQGSAALNKVLSDNFHLFSKAMWNPMARVVENVYGEALRPLTTKFNAKEFFPTSSAGRSEAEELLDDMATTITEDTPTTVDYNN